MTGSQEREMSDVGEPQLGAAKGSWRDRFRLALKLTGLCAYLGFLIVGACVVCGDARGKHSLAVACGTLIGGASGLLVAGGVIAEQVLSRAWRKALATVLFLTTLCCAWRFGGPGLGSPVPIILLLALVARSGCFAIVLVVCASVGVFIWWILISLSSRSVSASQGEAMSLLLFVTFYVAIAIVVARSVSARLARRREALRTAAATLESTFLVLTPPVKVAAWGVGVFPLAIWSAIEIGALASSSLEFPGALHLAGGAIWSAGLSCAAAFFAHAALHGRPLLRSYLFFGRVLLWDAVMIPLLRPVMAAPARHHALALVIWFGLGGILFALTYLPVVSRRWVVKPEAGTVLPGLPPR